LVKISAVFSSLGEIGGEMQSSDDSVAPIIIKRKTIINSSASVETVETGQYEFFIETFKGDASLGEIEMSAYQQIKEVQLEEGEYSIIFSGGLSVDPETISAVRD